MRRSGTSGPIKANMVEGDNIISTLPLHLLKSILSNSLALIHSLVFLLHPSAIMALMVIMVIMVLTVTMDITNITNIMAITAEKVSVASSI